MRCLFFSKGSSHDGVSCEISLTIASEAFAARTELLSFAKLEKTETFYTYLILIYILSVPLPLRRRRIDVCWVACLYDSRISQFCAITPTTVVKWYCNIYYNCSKSPSSRPAMIPSAIMIRHYCNTYCNKFTTACRLLMRAFPPLVHICWAGSAYFWCCWCAFICCKSTNGARRLFLFYLSLHRGRSVRCTVLLIWRSRLLLLPLPPLSLPPPSLPPLLPPPLLPPPLSFLTFPLPAALDPRHSRPLPLPPPAALNPCRSWPPPLPLAFLLLFIASHTLFGSLRWSIKIMDPFP